MNKKILFLIIGITLFFGAQQIFTFFALTFGGIFFGTFHFYMVLKMLGVVLIVWNLMMLYGSKTQVVLEANNVNIKIPSKNTIALFLITGFAFLIFSTLVALNSLGSENILLGIYVYFGWLVAIALLTIGLAQNRKRNNLLKKK